MQLVFENVNGCDEVYMDVLRAICGNTEGKSMVDLCCNLAPHTPKLGFKERVYVDVLPRVLDHKEEQQYFVQDDVLDFLDESTKRYDVTLCLDGIEHISKEDGFVLIDMMEDKSDRQVIFTPLQAWMMTDENDRNPESHRSLWAPDMLARFASIVFSVYHPTLNIGAWFGWQCENIEQDFERVKNELNTKSWAKNLQEHY